jgi:hypothetical protein
MRRCRPVTVALLVALIASLATAPLTRAQTTSVLPGTSVPVPDSTATSVPAPGSTGVPPSTATIQTTAVPQTGQTASTATPASDGPGTMSSDDRKLPVLLLAVIGALLLAAALAIAAARWWAYDPPWLVRSRHATAEAGWRTSAAWAEFRDWLRIGR